MTCACRGLMPQAREHTESYCAVVTSEELDTIMAAVDENRPLTDDELALVTKAGAEIKALRAAGRYDG